MSARARALPLTVVLAIACTQSATQDTTGSSDGDGTSRGGETTTSSDAVPTSSTSDSSSAADTSSTSEGDTSGTSDDTSSTGDTPSSTCAVSGVDGDCADVSRCPADATSLLDVCEGPPSLQCCLADVTVCSTDGAPGVCMPTAACPRGLVSTAGACPGDADNQCCADPALACDPRAMPLPNEGLVEEVFDPTCPAGMVRVAEFCIDRFEASLVVIDAGGDVVSSHSPYWHPTEDVRAVSIAGAVPQGYIDGNTAADACDAAGKRLCTDAEWGRACGGPQDTLFPYGAAVMPGVCNDARDRHPAIEYFGSADPEIWSQLGHPCILQVPDGIEVTGGHPACVTVEGAFDMVGNLHEWTADPDGTFRGGFFVDTALNGPGCSYATVAHDTSHWDYSTGFRCCAEATG